MNTRVALSLLCLLVTSGGVSAQTAPAEAAQTRQRDLVLDSGQRPRLPTAVPRGYAVIVGIAQYKNLDASKQLRFPESDAEAMYRVLINHEGGSFPPENVHFLKGRDATLANVRRELETWLPSVAQAADRVVVYFAGHGLVKDGRGYLAPYDVDPDHLDTSAYPMTTLGDVLATRVKAHWKVLLTDACHSGKITTETTDEALQRQFDSLPANFLTLTATTEREQSFEDPNLSTGFGVFTYFLVQAWQGNADHDPCDGTITADEMIEYVRTNVRRYARDRSLSQTPTARGDYEPSMPLGVSKACLAEGASAAPMLGSAIIEANLDDVELYIDGALVGRLSKNKPLTVPRLSSGLHEFKGVKPGYEPDRKEIMIAPGQESTVTLRIRYVRKVKESAIVLNSQGEKLLFTRRSSVNPMNIAPMPRAQSQSDLKSAHALFSRALNEDGGYSLAAFNLGQVSQLLGDEEGSLKAYRRAVEIDPTYVDAWRQYAAVLIERGDADEAIRQLTEVLRLDASSDEAYALMSRAYWDKGVWTRSVEYADKAIALKATNAQAHLWRADALRQLAAAEPDAARQGALYRDARESFRTFVDLTNYSTPAYEWFAFHFIGFHLGSRRHADRLESYNNLRSSGYLGLCICEHKVGNSLRAREYCQRALRYDANNPIAHFLLGNVNRDLFNREPSCDPLVAASVSYQKMLKLNPDLDESQNAKNYLRQIDGIAATLNCKKAKS
jgi:uncharacterized caspase-like protein/tetratricopeptide (TPR) repeat protein